MDHCDQTCTKYAVACLTKLWWLYIFWFILDLAMANAFACFKESPNHKKVTKDNTKRKPSILSFKQSVFKQLLHGKIFYKRKQSSASALPSSSNAHWPKKMTTAQHCKNCATKKKKAESRFICQCCSSKDNSVHLCIYCFG